MCYNTPDPHAKERYANGTKKLLYLTDLCYQAKGRNYSEEDHCICRDGLTPVLDAIREADGLIIGSPNYLSELTASFRALYERLIFQNLTYRTEAPRNRIPRRVP